MASSVKCCPQCGAEVEKEAMFCPGCGCQLG
ncbi:MAG: zinc-ribbon domain-containing protein [Ruthenibacterium sp.]